MGLFSRKKKEPPVDLNERSPETGMRFGDIAVLGQLMSSGADITQPRHVIYYSYFTSREAADAASAQTQAAGYQTEVRDPMPQYPGSWTVVSERHDLVLDPPAVVAADDLMREVAAAHGGDFDGWEASV